MGMVLYEYTNGKIGPASMEVSARLHACTVVLARSLAAAFCCCCAGVRRCGVRRDAPHSCRLLPHHTRAPTPNSRGVRALCIPPPQGGVKGEGGLDDATGTNRFGGGASMKQTSATVDLTRFTEKDDEEKVGGRVGGWVSGGLGI